MQIRSQYLIQDNHNDYTSEPPFSRACICLLSCTHMYIPSPDTYSPPFCGTHAYPFHPPSSSVPSRASARSCTVGSWKCLGAPRRSAGSRGKNATLLIIKYAHDGAQERRAGREGGNDLHVTHECTVWFGSTRQEIDDGSDEKNPAAGILSGTLVKMIQGIRGKS